MTDYDLSILIPARELLLVSQGVTGSTPATFTVPGQLKNVASLTVRLTSCLSCYALSSQYISSLGNKLKMFRITTASIAAEVVNLIKLSVRYSSRNWLNEIGVHQSVNTLCPSLIPQQPIALIILASCPYPALIREIDFGNNPLKQFRRHLFYFKHTRSIA